MTYIYKTDRIELREQIKKHAGVITGKILDIGAGSYARYQDLFKYSEYIRMDISKSEGVDLVGKIEHIPSPNNSFDSIICTQVLGDVFDLKMAFSEMYRVLRPDGVALITESLVDPLHDEPYDYWRFTGHSLGRLAEEAGFKIEIVEKRGGFFSTIAQLKARYWIERLNAHKKWFARPLSFLFRITGECARFFDAHDRSRSGTMFAQGYLLIARKHA